MTSPAGRHRSGGTRGLLVAGALIALFLGFLGGFVTDRFVLGGSSDDSATASRSSSVAPSSPAPPTAAPATEATNSPAPADPAPPGPQGEAAYLAALEDAGVPVEQHRDAVLVLGRGLCQAPPEQQADVVAAGERISAVVGDLLSPDQARRLAELAVDELC